MNDLPVAGQSRADRGSVSLSRLAKDEPARPRIKSYSGRQSKKVDIFENSKMPTFLLSEKIYLKKVSIRKEKITYASVAHDVDRAVRSVLILLKQKVIPKRNEEGQ